MCKEGIVAIEFDTRQRMKELAKKSQTYDDFINEVLDSREAKKKVYNEQNKEHIKEYKKNYWLDNKKQLKLKHKEYYKRNNGTLS